MGLDCLSVVEPTIHLSSRPFLAPPGQPAYAVSPVALVHPHRAALYSCCFYEPSCRGPEDAVREAEAVRTRARATWVMPAHAAVTQLRGLDPLERA
jgi:hypothetical protein